MNEMIKNNSEICFSEITNIAGIKSELIELSQIQENIVYKDIFRQCVNAGGIGLVILTGYGFYSFQNLYFCENHFLIIDADSNKLIFYNQTQTENGDPAKPNELRQNMLNGFDGYWIKKNVDSGKYSKK